ncbi:MAG TPA: ATP-binding domain-containing protein, partial [Tenericutes bacterium]|nr:ATP-binding domain-containing protein [Mycoplasmatota bacterium]
ALPVIREGSEVAFTESENNNFNIILERISQYKKNGYESIAIICKNIKELTEIYNFMKNIGMDINCIKHPEDKYESGLCIITSYLAKGLEFDAVIINDASENTYSSTSSTDMKLLYVAMTRALHEMEIIYTDKITMPLEKCLKVTKQKIKVLR